MNSGVVSSTSAREKDLKGEKGYHIYLRNSHNQIQARYKDGEMDKEAVPGKDVVTTIDADLQQYGQALMKNKVGSLVAIEPSTGEILTMVSSPGIDVEMLADIGKHYSEIVSDPHKPMFNRAVQAPYPPGSVFKLVNGLIGLEEGVLKPEYTYPCNKGYYFGSHKLGCHAHRSPLNLEEAIMMSCNGYFCYVMKNILENRKYSGPGRRWTSGMTMSRVSDSAGNWAATSLPNWEELCLHQHITTASTERTDGNSRRSFPFPSVREKSV